MLKSLPRPLILFSLALSLALAACAPSAAGTPAATVTQPAQNTPAAPAASPTTAAGQVASRCTVSSSLLPTASPTETALIPAITDADWSQGPATAAVTFLEYSDFQ